ncbi:uncharacterized protein TRIADDRAFT_18343 [Trichoplax adhaerens]|uniref:Protein kinase domain-containing protein n=1 Tax=Trichoplax adhaerens TaxID=10228 RepID=B3RJN0_TRIAD|nr:hypothetical protein TRIADDRAFT_18343 [Trichoplax adhaerens]EDV29325.1 hypothetical protein TRIADDRAFT_18343 [Trichoplax adhaerens]|eukprot:XP_002108527.1 hypothetical protein TRIADDRAFT_18343 [Trichoplax adhaerens]
MSKFVDRLKTVVNTAQSAVNTARNVVAENLMGNPVCREYEIIKHVASAGPLLSWKIYDGIKKSTKQPVSVFIFEKKSLEKMPKRQKEQIFDILKGGCKQLTKLRHPRFLTIEHGVEESRESLAFATEPVFASLANVFGEHHNMPQDHELKDYELYDVERKYGIMQLCEALSFLHEKASLIHGNVTPESIVINKSGAWKLAGLYFTVTKDHPQGIWESKKHPLTRPELNYLAPERITGAPGDSNLVASDMFSCGVLIHALHNNGKPLYDYGDNLTSYRRVMEQNTHMAKLKIPGSLADHCRALVNIAPTSRMDADDVIKTNFFEDVGAITLQYLDSLFQKDNVEKSRFFKHVHKVISNLPKRVIVQRVLTCLVTELTNSDMIPFVLPNILLIAEDLSQEEYMSLIFPHIKPLFALEEPVQILLIFMQKMELILKLTPTDEVNSFVLPLLYRALESSQYEIQEICLSILPNHTENIEYSYIKNNIIPRIKALCLDTTALSVRINCLVCLGKMLPIIDKLTVMDLILPMLQEIPSREAGVLMSILGIYKTTFEHKRLGFDLEHLARVAIPFLTPLCIESCLNANQFGQYNNLLKDMFGRIESEQSAKLKQLGEMQEETA